MKSFEQMKANIIKERACFNKVAFISAVLLVVALAVLIIFSLIFELYYLIILASVLAVFYVLFLLLANAKVRKKEETACVEKLKKIVASIVIKNEYDLKVMDTDVVLRATKTGFVIDDETYGYDNFDIFLGTSNLFGQVSIAVFVVSNFSPFADDKTYPINFGILLDGETLGCAKQYFFDSEYKAFNFILENPEQSAKEILKYGMLKIQIEERKKQKALEKLSKQLSNLD